MAEYKLNSTQAELLTETKSIADYFETAIKVGRTHDLSPIQIANTIINKKIDTDTFLPAHLVKLLVKHTTQKITDPQQIKAWVKLAIDQTPQAVTDFSAGKSASLEFLLGIVMRLSHGQADATAARQILLELLSQ